MILQNLDAVSEKKPKMGFCPLISHNKIKRICFLLRTYLCRVAKFRENLSRDGGKGVFGKNNKI